MNDEISNEDRARAHFDARLDLVNAVEAMGRLNRLCRLRWIPSENVIEITEKQTGEVVIIGPGRVGVHPAEDEGGALL